MASGSSPSKKRRQREESKSDANNENTNPDKLRFMVATDNHLGYLENDPVRGDDSFRAFEEVFQIARKQKVDFVLLGGDIFHDNKPSRQTLYKATQILQKYCMGSDPVGFEILSDQRINFPDTGCVNYENPNYNIALPVFSIHGNHDDPAGGGHLSELDLLSAANLVNYFGKAKEVDNITITPVLIRKGRTQLALYGLGSIRDERLHRSFRHNQVKWVRPNERDARDWFKMFVIHQNRIKHAVNQKNYIDEEVLPSFLDFIIWGHEHECRIEPEENTVRRFMVSQPGSSVATSLMPGEAVEKKVGIFELQRVGDGPTSDLQYRMIPIPLKTVRPFVIEEIVLSEVEDLEPDDPEQLEEFLTQTVEDIIEEVYKSRGMPVPAADEKDKDKTLLPLVRIKVDYTGFSRLTQMNRFGQAFVNRVANPEDILLFSKRRVGTGRKSAKGHNDDDDDIGIHIGEEEAPPIHDIINSLISNTPLSVLNPSKFTEAIQEYVDKNDSAAIAGFVNEQLEAVQEQLGKEDVEDENAILEAIEDQAVKMMAGVSEHKGADAGAKAKAGAGAGAGAKSKAVAAKKRGKPAKKAMEEVDIDDAADMDSEDAKPKRQPRGKSRGKAAAAASKPASRSRRKVIEVESEEDDDDDEFVMSDEDGDRKEMPPPRTKSKQPAKASEPRRPARKATMSSRFASEFADSDIMDAEEDEDDEEDWGSARRSGRR